MWHLCVLSVKRNSEGIYRTITWVRRGEVRVAKCYNILYQYMYGVDLLWRLYILKEKILGRCIYQEQGIYRTIRWILVFLWLHHLGWCQLKVKVIILLLGK